MSVRSLCAQWTDWSSRLCLSLAQGLKVSGGSYMSFYQKRRIRLLLIRNAPHANVKVVLFTSYEFFAALRLLPELTLSLLLVASKYFRL